MLIFAARHEVVIERGHCCLADLVGLDLFDGFVLLTEQGLNGNAPCTGNPQHDLALVGKLLVVHLLGINHFQP